VGTSSVTTNVGDNQGDLVVDRLQRYEERSSTPLLMLAIGFITVYAIPIIDTGLPHGLRVVFSTAAGGIWLVFAADLMARVALAERRWRYLANHPIDVLIVVLPALRPLRVLRVFTAGQALISRAGRFSIGRTTRAIGTAAALLVFIAAVAELDAERNVPGANIHGFGDALWWAATTVTTVGYGDRYPVSDAGRLVAAGLMLVGISLLGVVTASVAAWFVSLTRTAAAEEDAAVEDRLRRIEEQLLAIRAAVAPHRD
jgi:voltage-gated potassium channel